MCTMFIVLPPQRCEESEGLVEFMLQQQMIAYLITWRYHEYKSFAST